MRFLVVVGCCLLAGCGRVGFGEAADGGRDADADATSLSCAAYGPWSEPQVQDALGEETSFDWGSELDSDGTTITFDSNRFGSNDPFVATRANRTAGWTAPVKIDELTTSEFDGDQSRTDDGLEVAFTRRVDNYNCLYIATRPSVIASWSAASITRQDALCSVEETGGAWFSGDGLRLYYHEILDGSSAGIIKASTRTARSATFAPGDPVEGLQQPGDRGFIALSADELVAYWQEASPRRIFTATRASAAEPFGAATEVMPSTSPYVDVDVSLSGDGTMLSFSSTRLTGTDDYDIFIATRECL